jgi:hypothetical protein
MASLAASPAARFGRLAEGRSSRGSGSCWGSTRFLGFDFSGIGAGTTGVGAAICMRFILDIDKLSVFSFIFVG